jgi:hypothetical protein
MDFTKKLLLSVCLLVISFTAVAQNRLSPLTYNQLGSVRVIYDSILHKRPEFSYFFFSNTSVHGFYGLKNGELTCFETDYRKGQKQYRFSLHEKNIHINEAMIKQIPNLYENAIIASSFPYREESETDSTFLFSYTNMIAYCCAPNYSSNCGSLVQVSENIFQFIKEGKASKIESLEDSLKQIQGCFERLIAQDVAQKQLFLLLGNKTSNDYYDPASEEIQRIKTLRIIVFSAVTLLLVGGACIIVYERKRKKKKA